MTSDTTPDMTPLSDDELLELDAFFSEWSEEDAAMTVDVLDGLIHAVVVGPADMQVEDWLSVVWGADTEEMLSEAGEHGQQALDWVMRHYRCVRQGFADTEPTIHPLWAIVDNNGKEVMEPSGWAIGFVEGVNLQPEAWESLLNTTGGQSWYRPIGLLGEESFAPNQAQLIQTPQKRAKLAEKIPMSLLGMYRYWHSAA